MKKWGRKVLCRFLIVSVFFSTVQFAKTQSVYAADVPSILITEALPNSSAGVGTGDAFEYLELYNNSSSTINLNGYKFESHFDTSNYTTWDMSTSFTIGSEQER